VADETEDLLGVGVQCDAVILALDAGRTRLRPTPNAITALERAGAPILGIVVNRIKSRREHYDAYKQGTDVMHIIAFRGWRVPSVG